LYVGRQGKPAVQFQNFFTNLNETPCKPNSNLTLCNDFFDGGGPPAGIDRQHMRALVKQEPVARRVTIWREYGASLLPGKAGRVQASAALPRFDHNDRPAQSRDDPVAGHQRGAAGVRAGVKFAEQRPVGDDGTRQRLDAWLAGGYTTLTPLPSTAMVRPPPSNAARCARASIPYANPLTIVHPRAASSLPSVLAMSRAAGVGRRVPTMAIARSSSPTSAPRQKSVAGASGKSRSRAGYAP